MCFCACKPQLYGCGAKDWKKKWREKIKARDWKRNESPWSTSLLSVSFIPPYSYCANMLQPFLLFIFPPPPPTFSTALFYLFSSSSSFSWLKHKTPCNPHDPSLSGGDGRDGRQRKGRARRGMSESDVKRKRRIDYCANIISASERVLLRTWKEPFHPNCHAKREANFLTII